MLQVGSQSSLLPLTTRRHTVAETFTQFHVGGHKKRVKRAMGPPGGRTPACTSGPSRAPAPDVRHVRLPLLEAAQKKPFQTKMVDRDRPVWLWVEASPEPPVVGRECEVSHTLAARSANVHHRLLQFPTPAPNSRSQAFPFTKVRFKPHSLWPFPAQTGLNQISC